MTNIKNVQSYSNFPQFSKMKKKKQVDKILSPEGLENSTFRRLLTLRCLIKGYTRLFNFRNFDTLPSLIRVYPLIKFWKSV